ncbi:MAG: tetratricopeptide repeat protein [Lewinella sp.]|nr:tetratricopeptide repeat protein [Lewinella sp.]
MKTYLWLALLVLLAACGGKDQDAATLTGDSAIDAVTQLILEEPDQADLYAQRAQLYYEKNSYDQAIGDMTKALTMDSMNLPYHHFLADIYLDYFRSRLALQTMERAAAIAPENIPTLLKLSELQLYLKMNQASLSTIDKILKLSPQEPGAYFFMSKNFEEMGDTSRAINAMQEAVELNPEMVDGWIKLGQLHAGINGSLALDFFDNAIEVDSQSTNALQAKAEYLWDQDDPQGALDLYRQAIRLDPFGEEAYYNAGLVYLELDSLQQAYQHFNLAIENSPLYVGAYYFRGYSAEAMGELEQARQDYEHALRLSPDFADAQEALNRLQDLQ